MVEVFKIQVATYRLKFWVVECLKKVKKEKSGWHSLRPRVREVWIEYPKLLWQFRYRQKPLRFNIFGKIDDENASTVR